MLAVDIGGTKMGAAVVWPDVFTAWYSTKIPNIEAYVEAGPLTRWTYSLAARIASSQASRSASRVASVCGKRRRKTVASSAASMGAARRPQRRIRPVLPSCR